MKTTAATVRLGTATLSRGRLVEAGVSEEEGKRARESATVCMRKRKGGGQAGRARESEGGRAISIQIKPVKEQASFVHSVHC